MEQSRILKERALAAERSSKCWGIASIRIDILEFTGEEDEENVEKLVNLFKDDLQALNPLYHIPAKIDKQALDAALKASGVSAQKLLAGPDPQNGYAELDFPEGFRLNCLRGLHRAKAAGKMLLPGSQRWAGDLLQPGSLFTNINPDLERNIIEEYSAERPPDDGEIYRKIRKYQGYQGPEDSFLETRWRARLEAISPTKKKNLK